LRSRPNHMRVIDNSANKFVEGPRCDQRYAAVFGEPIGIFPRYWNAPHGSIVPNVQIEGLRAFAQSLSDAELGHMQL